MGWRDEWPLMENGQPYDGKNLMQLIRDGKSPFQDVWDVNLLIQEIEEKLDTKVVDIPYVGKGSNNYGFHIQTSNRPDVIARIGRGDVNMPDYDGFPIEQQVPEVHFEATAYNLLRDESDIRASRLLYSRAPVQKPGPKVSIPTDLSGRRLFLFERAEGSNNVWEELNEYQKLGLLDQLAHMRASLFNYNPPHAFCAKFLHDRLFNFKPEYLSKPVVPTREFWIHVFESKIEATIKDEGDMIGWEDDNETVGPVALAAKRSLLSAIPHILPSGKEESLYRLVLEHGDFGIHNTSIARGEDGGGQPRVTSLYDWETGCIAPALLSDPLVAAGPVDLTIDSNAEPAVTRMPKAVTATELEAYAGWARRYSEQLYLHAPEYETVIRAGKNARYLWYALRDWRGGDSEKFFGVLGEWAEEVMRRPS